jgi:hypothetical protein
VEQYLIFAEGQAMRRVPMHMADWIKKLDAFLTLNERDILTHAGHALLNKYAEHGPAEFSIPDSLKVPPLSELGNVSEIAKRFGGVDAFRVAVSQLQSLLYAA